MTVTTGTIDFTVGNETFQTWYKLLGDLNPSARPLIVLHGGPGMSHDYLASHSDLHVQQGIPVIFYDQIGSGKSSHLRDRGAEFWTYDLFMDELQNLLDHFGIAHNYDLLGHSWGGMLAAMFAAARKPAGLKHIVLVGTPASMELWMEETNKLLLGLPKALGDMLRRHEEEGTTADKEYQDGKLVFYRKHVCSLDPWPQEVLDSVAAMNDDLTVYHTMNGPSEFCITGTIKTWSVIHDLHALSYPILLTNGLNDEAQDPVVLPFFNKCPKVKWVQFVTATHMPFWEERERYMKVVANFLTNV
ncbi:proline-specific peptidase [Gloeophyllum trabeum ATCC 11539]|uniref:Proline-specific peptidase n=1 Tax=Gloeophyllum trabeum (strain ATCC 11539 / FP-39264 / Madison 617) TaxID=670483 RepID=S7PWA1_GLOTA|nr:proline-specific peptidase [Gloeophyllum trabeum ATCC 11539]EPQ51901.1 proline-specific peptidase [Gloeophyllum trabeum ATCC 11539]